MYRFGKHDGKIIPTPYILCRGLLISNRPGDTSGIIGAWNKNAFRECGEVAVDDVANASLNMKASGATLADDETEDPIVVVLCNEASKIA